MRRQERGVSPKVPPGFLTARTSPALRTPAVEAHAGHGRDEQAGSGEADTVQTDTRKTTKPNSTSDQK